MIRCTPTLNSAGLFECPTCRMVGPRPWAMPCLGTIDEQVARLERGHRVAPVLQLFSRIRPGRAVYRTAWFFGVHRLLGKMLDALHRRGWIADRNCKCDSRAEWLDQLWLRAVDRVFVRKL